MNDYGTHKLKYRGYDKERKRWFYGSFLPHINREPCAMDDELKESDITYWIIFEVMVDWNLPRQSKSVVVDKHSLGMFTGWRDVANKEIYEGDIVVVNGDIFSVDWNFGTCKFEFTSVNNICISFDFSEITERDIEIIGNIYENGDEFGYED